MQAEKDELPVIGYRYGTALFWPEDAPIDEPDCEPLTDHATATSKLAELQREVEGLRKDAERLEFILSCDFLAARTYLPDLNANDFIAKRRASLDEQIARRASLSSGRSGSGEVT